MCWSAAEHEKAMKQASMLRRLILTQAGAMALAYLLATVWMVYTMLNFGIGDLDRRMDLFAHSLAEAASANHDNPELLRRRLATAEKIFVDGFAVLNDAEGYVPIYRVWHAQGQLLYQTADAPELGAASAPGVFRKVELGGHTWQTVVAHSADQQVQVQVAERWDQRLVTNWPMLSRVAQMQLLALALCAFAMWWSARRGFVPLRQLALQLSARQAGELSPLHVQRAYTETTPIVDEVNALLGREARRLELERGFLADAAHELRTPLAAINAQAHLLLTAADVPTRADAAQELQQGMDRVSHLLAQLLTIARAEAAPPAAQTEALAYEQDLAALTRERLAPLAAIARARNIEVSLDAPEALMCAVDRGGYLSILDNLVDNAIRYTPSGGHVAVHLVLREDAAELRVCDDGPGIPAAERERVFDRFYRVPGTVQLGSGLGLAIVKRFVLSHNATVNFVDGLFGRGVGVMVLLPRQTMAR
jgi:signal transduction histidine kinase